MFNRLRTAREMMLALRYYSKNELDVSRQHVNKCLKISTDRDAILMAFDATLLILEHKSIEAKKRFEEARIAAERLSNRERDYVTEYCRYYECMICDGPECDRHRIAALEIDTSQRAKTWLTLPPEPI